MEGNRQGRSEGQDEDDRMQMRLAAQAQGLEGPLANAAASGSQEVRNPRTEGPRHETGNVDAPGNVIPARGPEEGTGHDALVQGARDVDMTAMQAGLLSRLTQVEKAVQGHDDTITAWQAHEDVPHTGVPQEASQDVQHAAAIGGQEGTRTAGVPQQLVAAEESSEMQRAVQAAGAEAGQFLGKLKYMKMLHLFEGNKPAPGHEQRSWQEWQGEFVQNAKLCRMDEHMYYDMALALLSNHMREVWLTYLKVKPEDSTWEGLDAYMGIHYATQDKTVDAEKHFEETKLQVATEKAWQTYSNAQGGHIADMGVSSERTRTDKGLWDLFLKNITLESGVHATAFQAYMGSKEEYDALPVQARITKLSPVMQIYMKSAALGQEKPQAAETGVGMAAKDSAGMWKGNKRPFESEDGKETADQKTQEPKAKGRKQPESDTEYHTVPKDVDYRKCADVGYQDNNESKPYSHSLRMHLQNEDRCLVCWDASHRIYNCPQRSDKLKEEMEAKKQRPGFRGGYRGGRGGRGWRGKY